MKLISWDEKYPTRERDASDMRHIIKYYLEGNNIKKLYDENTELLDDEDFDLELVGARILGRDIRKCLNPKTIEYVEEILIKETKLDSDYRLVGSITGQLLYNDGTENLLPLIAQILQGVQDEA